VLIPKLKLTVTVLIAKEKTNCVFITTFPTYTTKKIKTKDVHSLSTNYHKIVMMELPVFCFVFFLLKKISL